eukprot:07581_4
MCRLNGNAHVSIQWARLQITRQESTARNAPANTRSIFQRPFGGNRVPTRFLYHSLSLLVFYFYKPAQTGKLSHVQHISLYCNTS